MTGTAVEGMEEISLDHFLDYIGFKNDMEQRGHIQTECKEKSFTQNRPQSAHRTGSSGQHTFFSYLAMFGTVLSNEFIG